MIAFGSILRMRIYKAKDRGIRQRAYRPGYRGHMKIAPPNGTYTALLLILISGICTSSSSANSIPITGYWNLGDDSFFSISGPSLALGSDNPAEGGPGPTVTSCPGGSCVLPPQTGGPFPSGQAVASGSGGTFNGVVMYDLTGSPSFTGGTYKLPSPVSAPPSTITLPLLAAIPSNLTGTLTGYGGSGVAPCCPFSEGFPVTVGAPLLTFTLTGSGTADIYGFPPVNGSNTFTITDEQYNFTGVATVTPEPATSFMLALGFAALASALRLSPGSPKHRDSPLKGYLRSLVMRGMETEIMR
jgi:hypothetical protein